MDRKTEMVREEDERYAELCSLLARIPENDMERPGLTEDWTVKDLLGHFASWWAEAGSELEQVRNGTYTPRKLDLDQMNRRFYESNSDVDLHTIRAELAASRNKALEELWRLPEVTGPAQEWFRESGALHYEEHLADLRRFIESAG